MFTQLRYGGVQKISGLRDRHARCLHRASMAQARGSGVETQDETVSLA